MPYYRYYICTQNNQAIVFPLPVNRFLIAPGGSGPGRAGDISMVDCPMGVVRVPTLPFVASISPISLSSQLSSYTHAHSHLSRVPRVVYYFPTAHGCTESKTITIPNFLNFVYRYVRPLNWLIKYIWRFFFLHIR